MTKISPQKMIAALNELQKRSQINGENMRASSAQLCALALSDPRDPKIEEIRAQMMLQYEESISIMLEIIEIRRLGLNMGFQR